MTFPETMRGIFSLGQRTSLRAVSAGLILLVVLVVFAGLYIEFEEVAWMREIEQEIRSWGPFGAVASIAIMVVHSFVPFPAEVVAIANGMLFGALWGTLITWTGAMLGAFAAFGVARLLGRPFVDKIARKKDWQYIDDWIANRGWQVLLVSRFIPVIAFNMVNYAAGVTKVPWLTFAWTTGIGILPVTFLMVLVGSNAGLMTWEAWLFLAICGIVLWWVLRKFFSKIEHSHRGGPLA